MARSGNPEVGVLVVDDQDEFRSLLREVVARTDGMTLVGEAASGEEALEAAARLRPQLVIMDVRMPGLDGTDAAAHLVDARPETVVLLVSASDVDLDAVRSCGAAAFMPKHKVTPRALAELWRSAIRGDHGRDPRAPARRAVDRERAPDRLDPIAEPLEP